MDCLIDKACFYCHSSNTPLLICLRLRCSLGVSLEIDCYLETIEVSVLKSFAVKQSAASSSAQKHARHYLLCTETLSSRMNYLHELSFAECLILMNPSSD